MSTNAMKAWEVKPSTGRHLGILDGLRGIAILMVVCYHTFYTNPHAGLVSRIVGSTFNTGWMGVPIFFVLSGFLITFPFFRQRETDRQSWYVKGYARRRLGKIVPPFYLSIVIFGCYYFIRFSNPVYLKTGAQWALGLSNFIPAPVTFNASYWSLIVELHFYALIPILFFLLRGKGSRLVSWFVFAMLLLVPLAVRQMTWPTGMVSRDNVGFLMNRFPCALDYFSWGVLFAGFFATRKASPEDNRYFRYLGYGGVAALVLTIGLNVFCAIRYDINMHPQRWSMELFHFLPSVSTFLLLFFACDPDCLCSRFLAIAPLRFMGIVSYEWFLFHQPVVSLFAELIPQTRGSAMLFLIKTILPLVLTFAFSVVVYRYFSFPLLQWCRGDKSKGNARNPAIVPVSVQLPTGAAAPVEKN